MPMSFRETGVDISLRIAFLFYPLRVKKEMKFWSLGIKRNWGKERMSVQGGGEGLEISCFGLVENRGDETNP